MDLNYAIIGCGRISPNHIAAALNCGFRIVALCDTDAAAMDRLRAEFGLISANCYGDCAAMLERERLDLVSIATPSGSHAEIAIACCEHGVHTIIEKPVALSMRDARRIQRAASERGVKVTVCHQNRYNPAVAKAMEIVRSGSMGKVYCVSANILWSRDREYYARAAWRGTWRDDGGVLMNQGIHNIDLMRWFSGGRVRSVAAFITNATHPYIEVEDTGSAAVRFDNGCVGTINCTSSIYPSNLEESLYIMGKSGTIKLGGKSVNRIEALSVAGLRHAEQIMEAASTELRNIYGSGHTPLFSGFADAIVRDTPPEIPLEETIRSLELVLGIYRSAKENRTVDFPVNDFATTEMKGGMPWNLKD